MIVTIDGPAGSGKSTVARQLAGILNIAYLDTGATYRAVTLKALRAHIDMEDESALAALAVKMDLKLVPHADSLKVELDGMDVTLDIRSAEVTDNAHFIASSAQVRGVLVQLQQTIGAELGSFITEGRDQGSVVFPHADFKFYLDAAAEIRARRRCDEMNARGEHADYDEILSAIILRDSRDTNRSVAPLVKPEGAIVVDTSDMTIEQVVAKLVRRVEAGK